MQKALEMAQRLAVMEAIFLVPWLVLFSRMARGAPGQEPFDDGPWWSVWFFRLWAVCHLPVMLVQAGIHALLKKQSFEVRMPLPLAGFLYHFANLVIVVAGSALVARG